MTNSIGSLYTLNNKIHIIAEVSPTKVGFVSLHDGTLYKKKRLVVANKKVITLSDLTPVLRLTKKWEYIGCSLVDYIKSKSINPTEEEYKVKTEAIEEEPEEISIGEVADRVAHYLSNYVPGWNRTSVHTDMANNGIMIRTSSTAVCSYIESMCTPRRRTQTHGLNIYRISKEVAVSVFP